jgi:hypothetical protein
MLPRFTFQSMSWKTCRTCWPTWTGRWTRWWTASRRWSPPTWSAFHEYLLSTKNFLPIFSSYSCNFIQKQQLKLYFTFILGLHVTTYSQMAIHIRSHWFWICCWLFSKYFSPVTEETGAMYGSWDRIPPYRVVTFREKNLGSISSVNKKTMQIKPILHNSIAMFSLKKHAMQP